MNYAAYTITTIAILFTVFSFFVIKEKKWHYFLVHPYLLFLLVNLWRFWRRTTLSGMEIKLDLLIAGSTALMSIFIWVGYKLVSGEKCDRVMKNIPSLLPGVGGLTFRTGGFFWWMIFWIVLCSGTVFTYRYFLCDTLADALFSSYGVRKTVPLSGLRYLGWVNTYLQIGVLLFLPLAFIWPYIRDAKACRTSCQILTFGVFLLNFLIMFGSGSRLSLAIPVVILFYMVIALCLSQLSFSRKIIPAFLLYSFLVFIAILLMPQFRTYGIENFMKYAKRTSVQNVIANGITDVITTRSDAVTKHNQTVLETAQHLQKSTGEEKSEAHDSIGDAGLKDNTAAGTKEKIDTGPKEKIDTGPKEKIDTEAKEKIDTEAKEKIDTGPKENVDPGLKGKSFEFYLGQFKPVTVSDAAAWSLCHYGTYGSHLGMSRVVLGTIATFLPKEVYGGQKPLLAMRQVPVDMGFSLGVTLPTGPFVEGFIYAGYTGAIVFCIVLGLSLGALYKIYLTLLLQKKTTQVANYLCILVLVNSFFLAGETPVTTVFIRLVMWSCIGYAALLAFVVLQKCFSKRKEMPETDVK